MSALDDSMRVTVPGKIMLSGAYAVLHGATAVLATVDREVVAALGKGVTRSQFSAALLSKHFNNTDLADAAKRILALGWGLQIDNRALITADRKLGLGSSAASVAAATLLLARFAEAQTGLAPLGPNALIASGIAAHQSLQSERGHPGSGADVAACVLGGISVFCRGTAKPHATPGAITGLEFVVLAGPAPVNTAAWVAKVEAHKQTDPGGATAALDPMATASEALANARTAEDALRALGLVADATRALSAWSNLPIFPGWCMALDVSARALGGCLCPVGAGGGEIALAAFPTGDAGREFVNLATFQSSKDSTRPSPHQPRVLPLELGRARPEFRD